MSSKIYVVSWSVDWEGKTLIEAFKHPTLAFKKCESLVKEWKYTRIGYSNDEIEELPTGYKIQDMCFTYEEVELVE
jgi:hypothetical protein